MNNEILMKKLVNEKSGLYEKIIAEYIVWQLERMSNRELAEATAQEIEKGIFTMSKIFTEVQDYAKKRAANTRCACLTNDEVFKAVRQALKIDSAVPEAEVYGFVPSCFAQNSACCPAPVNPVRKAAINIDLDELF